jgi:hypothetical protein
MYSFRRHLERYLMEVLQILTQEWDPLQVKGNSEAEAEYGDYVSAVCAMLVLKKPLADIVDYLWEIETQVMGLDGNYAHTEEIARRLFALGEKNA